MAESLETRFRRLLLMVPYVLARPGVPVAEVCRRFGVSRSQLSSDISLLFVCGLPGYGPGDLIEAQIIGDRVWIRLADYFSRPLRLTPAEGLLLYAGARAMLSSGVADEALGRALERLKQALGPDTLSRVAVELEGAGDLATVREALVSRRQVHLVYYAHSRDEITERDVDPWALFVSGGRWYLVGWCHRVGDERIFRVDRIRSVTLGEAAADIPADLDLSRYESLYVEGTDAVQVVLDLAGEVAGWVAAAYPLQSREPLAGGWTRVRLSAGGTAWLEKLLLRLGRQARVVEPPELSERVRERACRLAARYAWKGATHISRRGWGLKRRPGPPIHELGIWQALVRSGDPMVIIKTTCPRCGEVDLTAEQIALQVSLAGEASSYSFNCPVCVKKVRKPADTRVIQLLISGGVKPEVSNGSPPEATVPRLPHPALTYDDLLDFHQQLSSADTVEALFRNPSR